MKSHVYTVKPLDSIQHARDIMEDRRVNQLPVVVDRRLVGIVTDRNLRDAFPSVFENPPFGKSRKRPHPGMSPDQITVEMVMTPHVLTLGPKDTVTDAARLMRRERIGAIPIVDGSHLVGILARSDVLDAFVALVESGTAGSP
ncbi:MAG: CBS domain-containing protein [Candidatus Binatia bacterium]